MSSWFSPKTATPVSNVTCSQVVDAYGKFLEEEPFGVGGTLPENKLPFDKSLIKEALAYLASGTKNEARREMLKAGFMQLAAFVTDAYRPSGLLSQKAATPSTREEVAGWFERHGAEVSSIKEVVERVDAAREVLSAEWKIRLDVCAVSQAERIEG